MFIQLLVICLLPAAVATPVFAFVYTQPLTKMSGPFAALGLQEDPCIPSGDHTSIQNALTGVGSKAELCPDALFELSETIYFTHDNQEIHTQGTPTDESRALLKIVHKNIATAVEAGNYSGLKLSHVIIDGNRPELGGLTPALVEWGTTGTGNLIEWVKAYEPRGWSILYLGEGDDRLCSGSIARNNELGPGGHAEYAMADGISLGCRNSIVENNTIVDVTDGGIVIFQAPGSYVANNTIKAENRVMFYGISMEDYGPYDGDFTGTEVTGNVIDAAGSMIRRGIGMGPHVGCIPINEATLRSRGAVITDNTLMGNHMGYGFVIGGVEDWTVTGNVDLSTHPVPPFEMDCFEGIVDPPGGFQLNSLISSGTFQPEFEASILGFTANWWPTEPVASEECLENLIGADVLEEIREGLRGEIMLALENAPNGELIGQCISVYQPPNIPDSTGFVAVEVTPLEPFRVEVKLMNISETDTVDLSGAEFLLSMFVVPCLGLPASLGPWEEARCIIDDYVAEGFQVLVWSGIPPHTGGIGFMHPAGSGIDNPEENENPIPRLLLLSQNHPNPFNPSTTIDYTVPGGEAALVRLGIYDLRGRLVRTLVDENREPGCYSVHWDGRDNRGKVLSSGVYLYRIEAGGFFSIRKMTILR